ncbi:3-isopropylmalate dehydratase large subunit [Bordetella sp. 15P40C-2]|uniref:3-isopropylmalate dehydratase large subunit n=1 Tax=Bordetella sp. 15P40C-2 TaxID=2572246 RepID=UPI001324FA94|nr:3-isopropylmalate dehydratase large subunit [Bordetella sp. 15P40C-2]MVW70927.1 3-isopropylmalate dehydratase large subunit [Bordetella sp. 15P40C-2]
MSKGTMFDKIWDAHVVSQISEDEALLHIDRHLAHELTTVEAIRVIEARDLTVRNPELTFATLDHVIGTEPGNVEAGPDSAQAMMQGLREQASRLRMPMFDIADGRQGIVHVIGPEQGLSLPGTTIVCGDSHTCTHGAFGALAWGIGSSEQAHVLATQTLRQRRPPTMRVTITGRPGPQATAKDVILHVIGTLGTAAATGHAVEFAGDCVRAFDMEARMTLCNLAIEMGARVGMIAPDETTYAYLANRPYAPKGDAFDRAVLAWSSLPSEPDAVFDKEAVVDVEGLGPVITWGTSPEHTMAITGRIPAPTDAADATRRQGRQAALDYMRLQAGDPIMGTPIDWVFIGSCANSRLSDLRAAAAVVRGKTVAPGVQAWVVPGSLPVKAQAEAEGLHHIFREAGFQWREPGCSMCVGANGDMVPPGKRCVSTSNRNFVGRQGPGALTHLASPATAAACAIAGHITTAAELEQVNA